jgi:hypothetical protein
LQWDRQPFLTTVKDGTPSMFMAWREIHHNFFIDNYSPQENVDNDDGRCELFPAPKYSPTRCSLFSHFACSCFYHTHDNFLVYGGNGMKNDVSN